MKFFDQKGPKCAGVNTEKKKSTLVELKAPKLYEHDMCVVQKAAGGLGEGVL